MALTAKDPWGSACQPQSNTKSRSFRGLREKCKLVGGGEWKHDKNEDRAHLRKVSNFYEI